MWRPEGRPIAFAATPSAQENAMRASLVLLCVATAASAGLLQDGDEAAGDDASWRLHMRSVDQFTCRQPQRRSVRVAEHLREGIATSETLVPHTTVLHRCDAGAGCCTESLRECRVADSEQVHVHFYVIDHVHKRRGLRVLALTNHTLCSCQAINKDIK